MTPTTVERYAYKNTHSTAGRPEKHEIVIADIRDIYKWLNVYGNPNYYIAMNDGTFYRLVDDYGGTNDLNSVPITFVNSRAEARRADWRLR
jgi:hypothetical protein